MWQSVLGFALLRQGPSFCFCHTAYSRLPSPWVSSQLCLHCPPHSTSAEVFHKGHWILLWMCSKDWAQNPGCHACLNSVFAYQPISHRPPLLSASSFSFSPFWNKFSVSSECPQTLCIAGDGFKCPILLHPPLTYWLTDCFRGKETPWSRQLIKHLIGGVLKLQSVRPWSSWQDVVACRQAWCWSISWQLMLISRQLSEKTRLSLVWAFETSNLKPSVTTHFFHQAHTSWSFPNRICIQAYEPMEATPLQTGSAFKCMSPWRLLLHSTTVESTTTPSFCLCIWKLLRLLLPKQFWNFTWVCVSMDLFTFPPGYWIGFSVWKFRTFLSQKLSSISFKITSFLIFLWPWILTKLILKHLTLQVWLSFFYFPSFVCVGVRATHVTEHTFSPHLHLWSVCATVLTVGCCPLMQCLVYAGSLPSELHLQPPSGFHHCSTLFRTCSALSFEFSANFSLVRGSSYFFSVFF